MTAAIFIAVIVAIIALNVVMFSILPGLALFSGLRAAYFSAVMVGLI